MKTAISVPDETFARVEAVAAKHGLNRSQFYSAAAERYAAELESADLTTAIDAVADLIGGDDSTTGAVAAGRRRLSGPGAEW